MEPKFIPTTVEEKIYAFWLKNNYFKNKNGKLYTILMPPPNANASLHAGHGMYAIDDIMIRWKLIQGYNASWIPGMDHAGFETQYVYEKNLAKQDKSRMDFDRQTLYNNIFKFVKDNSGLIYQQFKRLGFLADWPRSVFTLDDRVIDYVHNTFQKMYDDKLVYRSDYIVNYCVHCGTSLSELEVKHIERIDPLFYIKYQKSKVKMTNQNLKREYVILATTRPETLFGDTAIAVSPKDKRYIDLIGKTVVVPLLNKEINVISDEMVDPKFGTGVVKITPAHDPNDFLVGQRHNLQVKQAIDLYGRLTAVAGPYQGLKVKIAREKVVADLQNKGLMEKIDKDYKHAVTVCYKCNRDLEPTIIPNWFIKVESLKKPVISAVKKNEVKFYPAKYKKQILDWLEVMHNWPISRQVVWGIRIPVWYSVFDNPNLHVVFLDKNKRKKIGRIIDFLEDYDLSEIEDGLQKLTAEKDAKFVVSKDKPGKNYLQETDTFDTWFSSGQWPLVTLKEEEYETRFPTDVLGTLSDILPFWVSRMIMFSLYLKHKVPFKNVYLWPKVTDAKGQKMSKSKGNVINPIDLVNKYGADAFRASLVFGIAQTSQVPIAEDRVRAMRNFANKVWNIGRFIKMNLPMPNVKCQMSKPIDILNKLNKELEETKNKYRKYMERYEFSRAFDLLYEFIWHRFADYYIEELKSRLETSGLTPRIESELKDGVINGKIEVLEALKKTYFESLKMLHPFMPFVTEAVWQVFHGENSILNYKLSS